MKKHAQLDSDPNAEANEAQDAPDYIRAMRAKRRELRASLAGAGGLRPGIHGIMTVEEDLFGDRMLGPEKQTSEGKV